MKKIILSAIGLTTLFLVGCKSNHNLEVNNLELIHETEFGGVYFKCTIDEFNDLGFEYGDSVNIYFDNDYKILDLPYYNGYYVDAGERLLVGYPGYDYIKLAINYGDDYYDIIGLNSNNKAKIELNSKGKYLDIQETMNIQYKDEREFYDSDFEFGNYREISVGNIKPNILYRGASPCDNKHKRASCVDGLMEESGINFIMNLADTKEKIDSYINQEDFNSPYFLSLYKKNTVLLMSQGYDEKVMPLAMNMNYKSSEFRSKVAQGFRQLELFDGPYYIHCQEGKDRTGFVCIVIEALLGASYQEIVDDYMYTYKNYYKITLEKDPKRYNIIKERNVDAMLEFIVGNNNYKTIDLVSAARNYLKLGGLEDTIIDSIIEKLTK